MLLSSCLALRVLHSVERAPDALLDADLALLSGDHRVHSFLGALNAVGDYPGVIPSHVEVPGLVLAAALNSELHAVALELSSNFVHQLAVFDAYYLALGPRHHG